MRKVLPGGLVAILALSGRAEAVDLHKSRLTSVELSHCRSIARHKDGGAWLCPGMRGFPVYFAEGDLRHYIAFGPAPRTRRSATQTIGAFNDAFRGSRRFTIEWRTELNAKGHEIPFATIVRYATARDGEKGEVLVVTKVDPQVSCQLAVVDAKANPDAMAMARTWANLEARRRPCPEQPEVLGLKGKSPM